MNIIDGLKDSQNNDDDFKPTKIDLIGFNEIRKKLTGSNYLIKPFLQRNKIGILFGQSGSLKTFLVLDFALCVAFGSDFHGYKTHQGSVVYVCGEAHAGIAKRIEAWLLANNKTDQEAEFFVSIIPAELIDARNTFELAEKIREKCTAPALIVIDTLSTNIGKDGEESNNSDIATVLTNVSNHLRNGTSACVLIVHHTGHGDATRERGAYALRGNTDFRIFVERQPDNQGCNMSSLKEKDNPNFKPVSFMYRVIEIPGLYDSEGEQETSLVLEKQQYVEIEKDLNLSGNQKIALSILREKLKEYQKNLIDQGKDNQAYLSYNDWFDFFKETKPDTRKDSFKRSVEKLVEFKKVINSGGMYCLPH